MMLKNRLLTAFLVLFFVGGTVAHVESQSVRRMSVEELSARLGDSGLVVIDVRSDFDWNRSDAKVAGAVREAPNRIDWAEKYSKDSTLVLYCT